MEKIIGSSVKFLLDLPRVTKRLFAIAFDVTLCLATVWLSMVLRYSEFVELTPYRIGVMVLSALIAIPIFIRTGFYRAVFRYSGLTALTSMANSVVLYGLIFSFIIIVAGLPGVPRTIAFIQPLLLLVSISASRLFVRYWLGDEYGQILKRLNRPKVLIYGAGNAGRELANALANSPEMQVIGFLDDDESLHGSDINGQPIYNPAWLKKIAAISDLRYVLLANPEDGRAKRNEVLSLISEAHIALKTLPSMN